MRCANGSSSEARGGGSSHAADHASGADLCNRGFPCCYRFAEQIGLRSRRLGENRHPAQRTECNRPSELKARQPLNRAHFVGAHADWRRQARLVIELFVLILTAAMNLEDRIRTLMTGGDLRGAATATIEGYGPEIFGYLLAVLRDEADASDAYGQTCEDMWRGLAGFEGRSTVRTWLYTLANHARARLQRSPHRKRDRRVGLSEMTEVVEGVRARTMKYLRTSVKDRFAAIRASLDEDDRALLVMRVDREMSWRDIARTLSIDADSEQALEREAAKLRQRFQAVKRKIHALASEQGLLEGDGIDETKEV